MKAKGLEEFMRYVKDRAYNLNVRGGYKVSISVLFTKHGQERELITKQGRRVLGRIPEMVFAQQADSIEIKVMYNHKEESHFYNLKYTNESSELAYEGNRQYDDKNRKYDESYEKHEIAGLGNASQQSVESIVNKRLDEERKERKLTEQETTINEKNEIITKKTKKIESLESELEAQKEEIDDLEKSIESKKNFKYYAGMTGDILQSFGIKKEIIGKPLAGLLSGNTDQETKAIEEKASSEDSSGIVDDEPVEAQSTSDKRTEMIALIAEYLKGIDNQTLTNVFSIFSEIENNPKNSNLILEFINNQ